MYLERKMELSIIYWLKALFASDTFIQVEDEYPEVDLTLPTVAVFMKNINSFTLEAGNRSDVEVPLVYFEIFALNKEQRKEMAYKIFNALDEPIQVYDFDLGDDIDVITKLGSLLKQEKRMDNIRVYPELTNKLYYRATVSLVAIYDKHS